MTALLARLLQLGPLSAQTNPPTIPETHVDRARQFIGASYTRITTTGEIARHVGVSEDYLRHLFIEHGGLSLNRLLNQTRVEKVKELLIHSRLPIKEMAAADFFRLASFLVRLRNEVAILKNSPLGASIWGSRIAAAARAAQQYGIRPAGIIPSHYRF